MYTQKLQPISTLCIRFVHCLLLRQQSCGYRVIRILRYYSFIESVLFEGKNERLANCLCEQEQHECVYLSYMRTT